MPLGTYWPMTASFAGVPSLQANGSAGLSGDDSPAGVSGRLEIVPDPTGVRGNVMMSRLFEGDAESGNGTRSEIADEPSDFAEYWYSFKMMFGDDWGDFLAPFSLCQLHDTPDGGDGLKTPTMMLAILSGHIRGIVPGTLPTENQMFNRSGCVGARAWHWYDVCIHANWKKSGVAGFREIFIDGVRIWGDVNQVTSYDDVAGPFFKIGVYEGLNATAGWAQRTAYFSEVRVWSGAASYMDGMGRLPQPPAIVSHLL